MHYNVISLHFRVILVIFFALFQIEKFIIKNLSNRRQPIQSSQKKILDQQLYSKLVCLLQKIYVKRNNRRKSKEMKFYVFALNLSLNL